MTREEAIQNIKKMIGFSDTLDESIFTLFPELKESDDERIRKEILEDIRNVKAISSEEYRKKADRWIAWLEKQKELDGTWTEEDDAKVKAMCEEGDLKPSEREWLKKLKNRIAKKEQKPAWSEEDEKKRNLLIDILEVNHPNGYFKVNPANTLNMEAIHLEELVAWLKSLRPQPHKETYQAAKHDLAIKFMNYLDENKPEGKMCLSNGECEDIDRAFKENDWAKIVRYAEKYHQSEQKPEVKLTGWVARDSEHNPYFGLGLVLFMGKPIRSSDCWSGEIVSHLPWNLFPNLKWEDEPVEVEVTIRKKNAEL